MAGLADTATAGGRGYRPAREPVASNEYGGGIFAHTSPVYVNVAGSGVFDAATAQALLDEMRSDVREINDRASFAQRRREAAGDGGV